MSLDIYYSGKYVEVEVIFGDRLGLELFAKIRWTCPWCHKAHEWETTDHSILGELVKWVEAEDDGDILGNIQDEMPSLPAEIREVFISGICPECWHKAFNDVDGWMGSAHEDEDLPF
jgi:hypothetical protein